jgi:hypothetical protein
VSAFQANSPKRLAKQFIALPAMKFVQEILKIAWRRLLVALQPKQPRDFAIVKFVHFFAPLTKQDFSEIRPDNFAVADSRKRASNVPFLPKRARFY